MNIKLKWSKISAFVFFFLAFLNRIKKKLISEFQVDRYIIRCRNSFKKMLSLYGRNLVRPAIISVRCMATPPKMGGHAQLNDSKLTMEEQLNPSFFKVPLPRYHFVLNISRTFCIIHSIR